MSLCQFSAHSAALHPIANWCLDTFGEGYPMLIGVSFAAEHVNFHPVELWEGDPLSDLESLIAPASWDVVVIVATTEQFNHRAAGGIVAHAVDRAGQTATTLDEPCGRRRTLRTLRGRLHDVCLALFD